MANLEILQGDITGMAVDALVCPAHKHLTKGKGLSEQIFLAAGEALIDACAAQTECGIGESRITPAFDLPARFIIHTVTPMWTGGDQWGGSELGCLRKCFESVTALAAEYNLRTLAIPALGAGTNKFPHSLAAKVGLEVLNEKSAFFDRIIVMLRSDEAYREWCAAQALIQESMIS